MKIKKSLFWAPMLANVLVLIQLFPWWIARSDFAIELVVSLTAQVLLFGLTVSYVFGRFVRTFGGLRNATLARSRENILNSIAELRRLPLVVSFVSSLSWVVVALASLVQIHFASQSITAHSISIFIPPVFLSFAYVAVFTTKRCLDEGQLLCNEVDARSVFALGAPHDAWKIRNRVAMLSGVLVIVPICLLADLAQAQHQNIILFLLVLLPSCAIGARVAREAISLVVAPLLLLSQRATAGLSGKQAHSAVLAEGAMWELVSAYSSAELSLALSADHAHSSSRTIAHVVERVSQSVKKTTRSMEIQANALTETMATTEELAQSANGIADAARAVTRLAVETQLAAEAGQRALGEFKGVVLRMRQDNESVKSAVDRLAVRVTEIGAVVEFINGVAERCALLSMSAELEGTHAGESGRGFTLVGQELRRLAETVLESTAEVDELIGEIREAALATTESTLRGETASSSSVALVFDSGRTLDRIVDMTKLSVQELEGINLDTDEQKRETRHFAESLGAVLSETQNHALLVASATMTRDLVKKSSESLEGALMRFQSESPP